MRHVALVLAVLLTPTVLYAKAVPASIPASDASLAAPFSVDSKTVIPGATISPGQYTIAVIEHLKDRVILRVTDKTGKVLSTFLGLTTTSLQANGAGGPIVWTGKGGGALRGFSFPGAPPVEFVYPKDQAVDLAKANTDKVLAIDPASDNLSVTHANLSKQDMQIVTLWTLKATRVGPDSEPAIEAARYQAPAQTVPPAQIAHLTPSTTSQSRLVPQEIAANTEPAPPVARKHSIATLPHTASELPLTLLAAVLSLFAAAALRTRRFSGNAA